MKQDSRSPEQNRSLYPHPLPPDIESRVYIHKAILRKNINFKTDSFWFYSQTSFLAHTVIYMTPLTLLDMGGDLSAPPFFKSRIVKKTLSAKNLKKFLSLLLDLFFVNCALIFVKII